MDMTTDVRMYRLHVSLKTLDRQSDNYMIILKIWKNIGINNTWFLLSARPGKVQPEMVNVKSTVVRGYPDVRFLAKGRESWIQEAWHVGLKGQRVLIVSEIKDYKGLGEERHTESCDEEFSINTHLSKEVLGQHGIQLLMERDNSFFAPGVVGIIIIRTKIIFTYLEVTPEHFLKIMEKGEIDSTEAIIFYTRPFDYLNATDRQEIYEHMFWFGFIQSSYRMKKLTALSQ
ncbi:hypothetical protein FSP39_015199 [Pinctada imbricata]|uniref:Uncharacterized protein n=1 Tax=Pinctada imbricata TaxID=66713 RepID=A0AA88YU15_PINIB|nr:hypothetical protein FSP39_015199 [Pinctada imbricata]